MGFAGRQMNTSAPSGELLSALNTGIGGQQQLNMSEFPALVSQVSNMTLNHASRFPKPEEFVIQNEDFPALSTFGPGSHDSLLQHPSIVSRAVSDDKGLPAESTKDDADRYGLIGLLSVVRMTNKDLNTLALGVDLTTLGFFG